MRSPSAGVQGSRWDLHIPELTSPPLMLDPFLGTFVMGESVFRSLQLNVIIPLFLVSTFTVLRF